MPLTPADVRNKQFSTTRLRPGYDEEEVDAFLDEVEAELDRLIQENEELRAKLAECLRGKVPAMAAPIVEPKPDVQKIPEPPRPEPQPQPEPEPVLGGLGMASAPTGEDNMDTAARVLALAQQTADQAIADARREADETLGRARREAEEILGKARRQADQIVSEARSRAEALDRDAQERHRQVMGSLVQQREELEREVDNLRAFEREYRSRLKVYLEGQLRDLEAGSTETGAFAAVPGAAPAPAQQTAPQTGPQALPHGENRPATAGAAAPSAPGAFPPPAEHAAQQVQHSATGAFHSGGGDNPPHERR
ncbi:MULTISPECIES: DivIVA domain-containing protein [Actinomadura]|uniref:Cell wall synthesis protein Wag31 n=2 Tax=Actinomadura TaxID=1988 RepID=A0A5D0TXF4_9ACTN|nr:MULTISPECIES: DivIVA domain-containing protein [Actinomadura]TYC11001.1 DivIVA domain-containing protein [Actinomadura syzygii]TYK47837.1 DivIVA domain-containing protein [Actinomadura decatromicini]